MSQVICRRSRIRTLPLRLAQSPTWPFSSGPIVGNPPRPDPHVPAWGNALAEIVHAREHKLFAGKLDKSKLSSL